MSMCGMHAVSYLTTEERMVLDEAGLLQTSFSLYTTLPNWDTISSWLLLLSPEKRPIQRSAKLGKKRNILQQKNVSAVHDYWHTLTLWCCFLNHSVQTHSNITMPRCVLKTDLVSLHLKTRPRKSYDIEMLYFPRHFASIIILP